MISLGVSVEVVVFFYYLFLAACRVEQRTNALVEQGVKILYGKSTSFFALGKSSIEDEK